MRTLLVTAAIALAATAAHAQQMVPAKPAVAQETAERALPPETAKPSSAIIEQLKAAGELKDPKALEAPAPRIEAIEAKPAEAKPVEAKPVEAKPADTQPTIAKPAEVKPAETPKSVEAPKPVETKAVETKPAETKPVQAATEAKPAKKRVVRKRETDEQKARRIAAKYGVSW